VPGVIAKAVGLLWADRACHGFSGLGTARGWLLAAWRGRRNVLVGKTSLNCQRVGLLAAVLAMVAYRCRRCLNLTPILADVRGAHGSGSSTKPVLGAAGPILGEASCQPFKEGNNSVAMRWVLYREGVAMLVAHPYMVSERRDLVSFPVRVQRLSS